MNTYEFQIANHYPSAIVNDDWSGLTSSERADLDSFLHFVVEEYGPSGVWEFGEEQDNWAVCDVSGLFSDCVTANYVTNIHIRG